MAVHDRAGSIINAGDRVQVVAKVFPERWRRRTGTIEHIRTTIWGSYPTVAWDKPHPVYEPTGEILASDIVKIGIRHDLPGQDF